MRDSFASVLKHKNMTHLRQRSPSGQVGVRRAAFVLLDNFSLMAFTGAADALVTANLMAPSPRYDVSVVGSSGALVTSDLGIAISTDCSLADLDASGHDILVVCGGFRVPLATTPVLRHKLRSADAKGAILGGLWNGAFFLAEAGLLDGHDCAIHPDSRATLAELFPGVGLSHRSYVVEPRRVTCAGANSSLSMMLDLIRHDSESGLADAIDEVLSCDKSQELLDVSVVSIDCNPTLPNPLKAALSVMHNHIEEPMEVEAIAQRAGVSRRQLERLFRQHVDVGPARYYLELRLTHARQLLQQTNRTATDVAIASGFISITHFRNCFREFFHITPGEFRRRQAGKPSAHDQDAAIGLASTQ
ncbi:GlxA family transcriptional regulator [Salinicola aestuarinus]|uniref:GlxA family transcriptional regulator n=1 Tax=Salinicola aestuarinus TaxID=1949082 RepID=UPI000DA145C3|nr:GlxA family transcriptional regulator [Salinicola aestuarinus]